MNELKGFTNGTEFSKIYVDYKCRNIKAVTQQFVSTNLHVSRLNKRVKELDIQVPGGVLLGILGGDVPPGSPDPDPISNQKNIIFHTPFETRPLKSIPVFRPFL